MLQEIETYLEKYPEEIVQLFMKILITAMAAMAETGGPVSRSIALAKYLKNEGHQVATCIVEDVNYKANLIFQNNAIKINAEKLGQKLSERGGFGNILKEICGNN